MRWGPITTGSGIWVPACAGTTAARIDQADIRSLAGLRLIKRAFDATQVRVSLSNAMGSALASASGPSPPDSHDGAQHGAHIDGERNADRATNGTVQIHAAGGQLQPSRGAGEIGGAVLRGVRRAPGPPAAERGRPGPLRARDRVRRPRIPRAQPPARRRRPAGAGLPAGLALVRPGLDRNRRLPGGGLAAAWRV